jgi:hypothetical protein
VLRRMRPRRVTAAVVTGVLATTGALIMASPAAQATEVAYTSACVNDFVGPVGNSDTKIDVTVSPVKDTYTVGDTVTIDWKWLAYNNVPTTSPTSIGANSTKPFGDIALSGAQTDVVQVTGPANNPPAAPGEPLKVADMTGTFVLSAPGSLTLTPKGYKTDTGVDLGGTVVHSITTCNPAPGSVPGAFATLNVQGQQTADPVVSGPAESHAGFEIDLTGSNFAPSATPQLSLCQSDGSQCDPTAFASNTLAIDAQGKLSGKATLRATMLPNGSYKVKVSDGAKSGSYAINITPYVPSGQPAATATPNVGKVGDTVTVKGVNFPPSTGVFVFETNANGDMLGDISSPGTDAAGNVTAQVTISKPETTAIRITDFGSATADAPFTILAVAPVSQNASVTLAPGALSMTQAGDGLNFGSVTLNGEAQTVKTNLNQVTVLDARGGNLGWSLTGSMTDLVAANGTDKIPAGNLSWTPSCAAGAGSLSTVTNGTAGALSTTPSTLCSVAADGKTSGGKFTGDAEISLTTPQFAAAGAYTGTLTLTLI